MVDREIFIAVVDVIMRATSQNEMQSRGFVRRLLKQAGLNAEDVTPAQLEVVGRRLLADALKKNGISDPEAVLKHWNEVCSHRSSHPRTGDHGGVSNTVEAVFARIGLGGHSTRGPR